MAGNRSSRKRNSIIATVFAVLVLVLLMALVGGIIYNMVNDYGSNGNSSVLHETSSEASLISSETDSQTTTSTPASSEESSSTVSTPISSVVSNLEQNPDANAKICYLTFDDGPSKNTLEILKILERYNAKATFFVVGNAVRVNPTYLKMIVDGGHTIGLHANQHEYSVIYKNETAYFNDLAAIDNLVYNWTGIHSKIIRFPGGSSNMVSKNHCVGIMTLLTQKVVENGYYYFDWNVDSNDASEYRADPQKIIDSVKKNAYGNQICVLMHDTAVKTTTVEALPEIIEYLQAQGYEFRALDETSRGFRHKVNN